MEVTYKDLRRLHEKVTEEYGSLEYHIMVAPECDYLSIYKYLLDIRSILNSIESWKSYGPSD